LPPLWEADQVVVVAEAGAFGGLDDAPAKQNGIDVFQSRQVADARVRVGVLQSCTKITALWSRNPIKFARIFVQLFVYEFCN
jgi:hypothetical protein